jgi:hypothetical protein
MKDPKILLRSLEEPTTKIHNKLKNNKNKRF